jgi:hypothetical protein
VPTSKGARRASSNADQLQPQPPPSTAGQPTDVVPPLIPADVLKEQLLGSGGAAHGTTGQQLTGQTQQQVVVPSRAGKGYEIGSASGTPTSQQQVNFRSAPFNSRQPALSVQPTGHSGL